jgi:hypothetical protein
VSAPAGRADDFSWPRPASNASAAPEVSPPQPVAAAPATPPKQGDAAKKPAESGKEANKDASKDSNKDANKDTKNKAAKDPTAAKPHRAPNADLDGAPIPPAPVGSR